MTIFRKTLVTLGTVSFLLTAALVLSVLAFMNSLYYETASAGLLAAARALQGAVPPEELAACFNGGLPGKPPFFAAPGPYRLTLIASGGEVLWDSRVPRPLVNHLDREEIRAALEGREGRALRDSLSAGNRQLYAALPVYAPADASTDGGANNAPAPGGPAGSGPADSGPASAAGVIGVFRLSMEIPSFWRRIAPAALPFLCFALFLVLAAFGGIYGFSRNLSRSLHRLVRIAAEAGENEGWYGPASAVMETGVSAEAGEILTLEKALRTMAAELQRRLEDARTEGNRLEAIINSMSGAVLALDKNLNLLFVNPPARRLFKLEHRTIRGLSLLEAVRSAELDWAARKVLSGEKPEETELRLCEGASVRRFHVFTAPLPSPPGGGSPGAVMVLEDLTRLVRLEQIRRDFVANVSHELRTPVQLIKGFAETLLDDGTGPDQIRRGAGIILKNALTMENLINDLLSLAGLEDEGRGRPGPEDLALAPLFDEALASVGPRADKKGISFTVECPAELRAPVYGSFVVQALINLLDNAVKYSPASSRIRAAARREGEDLVLEVRDEGIGIAAEHLERIFERFYRVDRSRGREEGSTGLGLSIVRHIALLHGGRTEVESHAGEGSVFRVRIPAG